ncbi:MAG: DNRLRE domain-containing protein [Chitinophagaceae bacterium]
MKVRHLVIIFLLLSTMFSCKKVKLNKAPIADAGPAVNMLRSGDTATLTGKGTDADGIITGYLWSEVSGPNIPYIHTPGSVSTKVTNLIAGKYYFQLMVIDDDGATGLDTVSVTVLPAIIKTLTLQPGPGEGQDAFVFTRQNDNASLNTNFGISPQMTYQEWTWNADGFGEGTLRTYLKFSALSAIPSNAEILSAKLNLYGVPSDGFSPQGNSHYPGSPYGSSPDNTGWLQRVTSNWDQMAITWNNKPGTTNTNQLSLPGTTARWNFNLSDLDVTEMIKTMVSTSSNFGFCLSLQNEATYRCVLFASSEASDPGLRPKLVVVYR